MYIEDMTRVNMLWDFYGELLTEKQQGIVLMYYGNNMSLGEIAADIDISRQGVHDALRKALAAMEKYEDKLGLMKKFQIAQGTAEKAKAEIDELAAERRDDAALLDKLRGIYRLVEQMEQSDIENGR
jgi:predicted DNA-binding protein YlxM (UPF0122 family)